MCNIPLLDIPLAILDKYKGYPLCEKKGTLLPVPCNQKANSYLKEIADFCGIKKNLTTHTGRHTFSTVGKKVYYKVAEVQKLLDSGRIEVATKE